MDEKPKAILLLEYQASECGDTKAMVQLAQLYSTGVACRPQLDVAFGWAQKAAERNSADGYMEIVKILGSACIGTDDAALKIEYADNVIKACDHNTVTCFNRADIACAVGTVCEYMADFGRVNSAPGHFISHYREQAVFYYDLATKMHDLGQKAQADQKTYAQQALARLNVAEDMSRTPFTPKMVLPYPFFPHYTHGQ